MFDTKFLDDLAKKLSSAVPPGVKAFEEECQNQFRSILQSAFSRLDLVTREEFDTQCKVLGRTRAKLDDMEAKIASLEGKLADRAPSTDTKKDT